MKESINRQIFTLAKEKNMIYNSNGFFVKYHFGLHPGRQATKAYSTTGPTYKLQKARRQKDWKKFYNESGQFYFENGRLL